MIDTDATEAVDAAEALAQTGEGPSIGDLTQEQEAPVDRRYAQVVVNVTQAAMYPGTDPITVWYPDDTPKLTSDQALHLSVHLRTAYDLVEHYETMRGQAQPMARQSAR